MDSYDRNIICIENYIKEVICDSGFTIDEKVDLIKEICIKEHDRELKEALEMLLRYAMISEVTAVIYPEGTHKEWITKANQLLIKMKERGIE